MSLTESQIKMMQEDISADLVEMLMIKWNCSMETALGMLYNSETFERLQDAKTCLYIQSSGYVYSFLEQELTTGKFA